MIHKVVIGISIPTLILIFLTTCGENPETSIASISPTSSLPHPTQSSIPTMASPTGQQGLLVLQDPSMLVYTGIPETVRISDNNVIQQFNEFQSLSSGLYILFQTLSTQENGNRNYEIWIKPINSGDAIQVASCANCPIRFDVLSVLYPQTDKWLIVAGERNQDGREAYLIIDPLARKSRLVECSTQQSSSCTLRILANKMVAYTGGYPPERLFVRLFDGDWFTISGPVLDSNSWAWMFYREGLLFYPLVCDGNSSKFFSLERLAIQDWPATLCVFGDSKIRFLGWSSFADNGLIGYASIVNLNHQPGSLFHNIIVCPSSVAITGNTEDCFEVTSNLENSLPFEYSLVWLNESSFLWYKSASLTEGCEIGTISMQGTIRNLYRGESITYTPSPEGTLLLFQLNDSYGTINTVDGTIAYLPLPEEARSVTWLRIP